MVFNWKTWKRPSKEVEEREIREAEYYGTGINANSLREQRDLEEEEVYTKAMEEAKREELREEAGGKTKSNIREMAGESRSRKETYLGAGGRIKGGVKKLLPKTKKKVQEAVRPTEVTIEVTKVKSDEIALNEAKQRGEKDKAWEEAQIGLAKIEQQDREDWKKWKEEGGKKDKEEREEARKERRLEVELEYRKAKVGGEKASASRERGRIFSEGIDTAKKLSNALILKVPLKNVRAYTQGPLEDIHGSTSITQLRPQAIELGGLRRGMDLSTLRRAQTSRPQIGLIQGSTSAMAISRVQGIGQSRQTAPRVFPQVSGGTQPDLRLKSGEEVLPEEGKFQVKFYNLSEKRWEQAEGFISRMKSGTYRFVGHSQKGGQLSKTIGKSLDNAEIIARK
jgi:hypothetical protein